LVLGELGLKMNVIGDAAQVEVPFADAIADFSQASFEVKKAIDGKRADGNNGWAVHPQTGVPHFAAFSLKAPIGNAEKGVRLRFELHQPRPGGFSIGRFRVWATTSANPLNIGYPASVVDALKEPAPSRTPEEQSALAAYWKENDPELRKRRFAHVASQRPLPEDPGVAERRAAITRAEEPVKLDPRLVQLRADVEQSKAQLANQRLTGVQDLAWALINTPAFLFNR
jgi:hypothetical protein